jgi:N-acetylneuraminic acid mutarotase
LPFLRILQLACVAAVACGDPSDDSAQLQGRWTAGVAMPEARLEGAAVAAGGKILSIGGITGIAGDQKSARASDRVDVFDPSSSLWTQGASLPESAARHHLAVAVLDDRVYLLGGFTGIIGGAEKAGKFLPNQQTWVLDGGVWARKADQPIARGGATAQAIGGKILVMGGGPDENVALPDVYAYDPGSDTWSKRAPMPTARQHLASCALDGTLLAIGGWGEPGKATTATVERYDPIGDTWTRLPDLHHKRGGLSAAVLAGRCHVLGGERWDVPLPATFAIHEAWSTANPTQWAGLAPLPEPRHGMGLAALDGKLWALGGGPVQGNSYTARVDLWQP